MAASSTESPSAPAAPSSPSLERRFSATTRPSPMTRRKTSITMPDPSTPLPSLHELLNATDRSTFDNTSLRRVLRRPPFAVTSNRYLCASSCTNKEAEAIVGRKAPFSILQTNNNNNNETEAEEVYPLFAALALGASQDIIHKLYDFYPMALGETTRAGHTALHIACQHGAPAPDVVFLLRHCPSHAKSKSKETWSTPIHLACSTKRGACVEVIRALAIQNPAAFAEQDRRGNTPLHLACLNRSSSPEVIRSIVAHRRAALETTNLNGMTPLHAACLSNQSFSAAKTIAKKYPEAAIQIDSHGNVPAHYASSHGSSASLSLVRTLLEVDPQSAIMKNRHGHTPFDVAQSQPSTPKAVVDSLRLARDLKSLGPDSDAEAATLHKSMQQSGWASGANLVLDIRPGLIHKMNVDERMMPQVLQRMDKAREEREKRGTLKHVSSSSSLSAMFEVICGLPEMIRDSDDSVSS
uniref:Uncharacterized protein n=1 Tax=Ditylum brightwellii TaxID=49249 RepID=A0A7S2EJM5_9STRA|mmetsp:Transcript_3326/g.5041  ORF Transcript_3326/g.5041 Transcript_3326/m.5041 type:complete len:467 (+) Transcript_3326:182-1582(+)